MRQTIVGLWLVTVTLLCGQSTTPKSANNNSAFRGTLLDAPCAENMKADSNNGAVDRDKPAASSSSQASVRPRTPGDLIPCQATITTTIFALRTDDGRVLRFDAASNGNLLTRVEREAQWKDALSAVSGSPNDGGTVPQDRTAGKDVTASGVTKKAGTARLVEATGSVSGSTLHVDTIRLRTADAK